MSLELFAGYRAATGLLINISCEPVTSTLVFSLLGRISLCFRTPMLSVLSIPKYFPIIVLLVKQIAALEGI